MERIETLQNNFRVIGAMSGTSLDGLDLAAVEFKRVGESWLFKLVEATTIPYSKSWTEKLMNAPVLSGEDLFRLHQNYGRYLGEEMQLFIRKTGFVPDFIASHGHTVFHRPDEGFTLQIGCGQSIASTTGLLCINDFRTADVLLGGQGAPLVPVGDRLLFSEFDYCLNLGGIANISFEENGRRKACDICPVNMVLNWLAAKFGLAFDKDGETGSKGNIDNDLLNRLNSLAFYTKEPPKSLGREWVEETIFPVLHVSKISDTDKLRTFYEHIAIQISKTISRKGKVLLSGGGAMNSFLVDRIQANTRAEIVLPERDLIEYKEALIFAFLGVLRRLGVNNCLASVTGASRDSCSGVIHLP